MHNENKQEKHDPQKPFLEPLLNLPEEMLRMVVAGLAPADRARLPELNRQFHLNMSALEQQETTFYLKYLGLNWQKSAKKPTLAFLCGLTGKSAEAIKRHMDFYTDEIINELLKQKQNKVIVEITGLTPGEVERGAYTSQAILRLKDVYDVLDSSQRVLEGGWRESYQAALSCSNWIGCIGCRGIIELMLVACKRDPKIAAGIMGSPFLKKCLKPEEKVSKFNPPFLVRLLGLMRGLAYSMGVLFFVGVLMSFGYLFVRRGDVLPAVGILIFIFGLAAILAIVRAGYISLHKGKPLNLWPIAITLFSPIMLVLWMFYACYVGLRHGSTGLAPSVGMELYMSESLAEFKAGYQKVKNDSIYRPFFVATPVVDIAHVYNKTHGYEKITAKMDQQTLSKENVGGVGSAGTVLPEVTGADALSEIEMQEIPAGTSTNVTLHLDPTCDDLSAASEVRFHLEPGVPSPSVDASGNGLGLTPFMRRRLGKQEIEMHTPSASGLSVRAAKAQPGERYPLNPPGGALASASSSEGGSGFAGPGSGDSRFFSSPRTTGDGAEAGPQATGPGATATLKMDKKGA